MKFQSGQSGNPGGRPKAVAKVKELARVHTEAAIETLVEIATNKRAAAAARVSAATSLLDRAWGKPTQPLGNDDENPLTDPKAADARILELLGKAGITGTAGAEGEA